jgi:hypothetical protein
MKDKKESAKVLTDYYEAARKSFIAKMKSEDEEQINLKIKIATYVIYELSHSSPPWFKNYFLSNISKDIDKTDIIENKKIFKMENAFFNNIGDYLINMESEVEYVKKMLASCTEEWDKKAFWKPIVVDAFLLVGIYFTTSLELSKNDNKIRNKRIEKNANPRFLFQMLSESSAVI